MKSLLLRQPETLEVVGARCPTYLERLLLGITCIGFCAVETPETVDACRRSCGQELFKKLGRVEMHQLPPKENE